MELKQTATPELLLGMSGLAGTIAVFSVLGWMGGIAAAVLAFALAVGGAVAWCVWLEGRA